MKYRYSNLLNLRLVTLLFSFLSLTFSYSQTRLDGIIQNGRLLFTNTTVSLNQIIIAAADINTSDTLIIDVDNCDIREGNFSGLKTIENAHLKKDSLGRIITNKKIIIKFHDPGTKLNYISLRISDVFFGKPIEIINYSSNNFVIEFSHCNLKGFEIYSSEEVKIRHVGIYNCTLSDILNISIPIFKQIDIDNNVFTALNRNPKKKFKNQEWGLALKYLDSLNYAIYPMNLPWMDTIVYGRRNLSIKRVDVSTSFGEVFSFYNNKVEPDSIHRLAFSLGKIDNLTAGENKMHADLTFNKSDVTSHINLSGNKFYGGASLCFSDFTFPENGGKVYWNEFSGYRLGNMVHLPIENFFVVLYKGETDQELANTKNYLELLKVYEHLYTLFKTNGDIESANGCYVELKDLEGNRLKYVYQSQGGFNAFFSWKLNRLMKTYTEHGTDPARAIVYSIWIIFFFGIFYFFFPSDWDVASKSRLIKNFKEFIQKNDKGYIKPFLRLLAGFLMSLVNAFTLSLNAFTTLGFGNIPTHGLARYVCIVQGFIGWFLLSLFTVALINQALF